MKRKYLAPSIEWICLEDKECLCVTSEIDMGGDTNHYDSRRKHEERFDDDEFDEDFEEDGYY